MIKICVKCGKEFNADLKRRKYCSQECFQAAVKENKVGHTRKKKERVKREVVCAECGETFITDTFSPIKYCSKKCSHKATNRLTRERKKRSVRVCRCCKKEFVPIEGKRFCSKNCEEIYNGKKNKKNAKQLTEIARLANAEGLSYGQWVAKHDAPHIIIKKF